MATFVYEARDKFGKLIKGSMTGESIPVVSSRLQSSGYVPIRIDVKAEASGILIPLFARKVKNRDINLFTRQLYTMQKSGLPLLSSLRSLEEQAECMILKKALNHVAIDIESGISFHEALSRQPKAFDDLYVRMVEAGEMSGRLDDVLQRISFLSERNEEIRSKIKAALRYPLITLVIMVSAFFLLVTLVVPKFATLFMSASVALPLPTRLLMGLNNFVRQNMVLISGSIFGAIFLFRIAIQTKLGRLAWHSLLLKIPVFGNLLHEIYMARLSRNLAVLMQSGLPILHALELVANTVGNVVIGDAVKKMRTSVSEGKSLHEPMKETPLFSSMVVQMVMVGEETGKVDELLNHVADYYDFETDMKVKNMTALIEPVLIVGLGIMVLVLALGIFLPMWNMIKVFK